MLRTQIHPALTICAAKKNTSSEDWAEDRAGRPVTVLAAYPLLSRSNCVLELTRTTGHRMNDVQSFVIPTARLAQSAERKALNLVVVGSSPTVGVLVRLLS